MHVIKIEMFFAGSFAFENCLLKFTFKLSCTFKVSEYCAKQIVFLASGQSIKPPCPSSHSSSSKSPECKDTLRATSIFAQIEASRTLGWNVIFFAWSDCLRWWTRFQANVILSLTLKKIGASFFSVFFFGAVPKKERTSANVSLLYFIFPHFFAEGLIWATILMKFGWNFHFLLQQSDIHTCLCSEGRHGFRKILSYNLQLSSFAKSTRLQLRACQSREQIQLNPLNVRLFPVTEWR